MQRLTSGKPSPTIALLALLAAMLGLSAMASAVPPEQTSRDTPKAGKDEKIATVTYGVADLLENAAAWRPSVAFFAKAPPDGIEGLARVIILSIGPEIWEGAKGGTSTLRELDGAKLEITATAARHAQVEILLRALRGRADISVTLEADWYELDRAFYQKEIEAALAKGPAAVAEDMALKVRKQGVHLRYSKPAIPHGKDARLSLRNAFVYVAGPGDPKRRPDEVFGTAFHGVSFQVRPAVSADLRSVRLRVAEQVTELAGIRKEKAVDVETGKVCRIEVPELRESSSTLSVRADDGQFVLVPVHYRPRATADKGRVLVLLLQPTIIVEEEERSRGKNP